MEEYRKVDGYTYYFVSDLGNVKTVDRVVKTKGGWTEERRRAVGERIRGRHHTEESKLKMRGRIISAETRAKMSDSAINRKRNKEGKFICQ